MNIEVVTDNFSTLLQVAQAKVAAPNDVVVSSIPPRTDSTRTQQRVEELNSILQETSTTLGAKFISNDTSFRLADGLPNDGYLSSQLPGHKLIGYEPWSGTSGPGSTKHQDPYDSESR